MVFAFRGFVIKIILYRERETKTKTFEEEKIMKTRKVMALAGAGVLAVSMMTGCGSSSSTASTTAATTTAAAAETTKEAATAADENCRSYRINYSGRFFRIKTAG